jgi:hypothetical protein
VLCSTGGITFLEEVLKSSSPTVTFALPAMSARQPRQCCGRPVPGAEVLTLAGLHLPNSAGLSLSGLPGRAVRPVPSSGSVLSRTVGVIRGCSATRVQARHSTAAARTYNHPKLAERRRRLAMEGALGLKAVLRARRLVSL